MPKKFPLKRPAVFLDRDGTINVEKNYLYQTKDWEWIPGAIEAIHAFNDVGYAVVIVTNQAGMARGYYREKDLHHLHGFINEQLAVVGAKIDGYYHCPHHPDFTGACDCRKPLPGLLLKAAAELNLDLTYSWMIGDRITDMQAATAAGIRPLLVRTGYGESEAKQWPKHCPAFPSIAEAGMYVIANTSYSV